MPLGKQVIRDLTLLVCGAALYTIATPPYDWSSAAWLALTPLFLVLRGKRPGVAYVVGFLYGIFFCIGIASWVYDAVAAYFALGFPFDLLATFLSYSLFVSFYTGLAACCSCVLLIHSRPLFRWIGIPALWVSAEFARTSLFSGFSWELLGYTQYRQLPFIQIADITGVYGLSFLLALAGYIFAESLALLPLFRLSCPPYAAYSGQLPWPALGLLLGMVVVTLGYGVLRLHQYANSSSLPLKLALVEGNVTNEQRWQRVHYAATLLQYISVTRQGAAGMPLDLVVWPEFAVGFYLEREPLLRTQIGQLARSLDTSLLLGAPRVEETAQGSSSYYNSAYLFAPTGELQGTYDKMRLLPFAEYRPLPFFPAFRHGHEFPSEFTPGHEPKIFFLPRATFGVTICYEATYPVLSRRLVRNGAQFLVNISNDTWLAKGKGATAQHFSMAVFRAVENKRPLVRATTGGISGFIDPTGHFSHLSTREAGVLVGEIRPQHELTVYTRYGDWFALSCGGIALLALWNSRRPFFSRQR
jgi:apolipoprotein N-acyltransferase